MTRLTRITLVTLSLLLVTSCARVQEDKYLDTMEMDESVNELVIAILETDYEKLTSYIGEPPINDEQEAGLIEVLGRLPDEAFLRKERIGYNNTYYADTNSGFVLTHRSTFLLYFVESTALLEIHITSKNKSSPTVKYMNINTLANDWKEQTKFTLLNQPLSNYLVFGLAVFSPILIVITFVACWRNEGVRRRKTWLLFILFGFGVFVVNWSTGEWQFRALSFQLLGGGYLKSSVVSPYVIKAGLPLPAIAYWIFLLFGGFGLKFDRTGSNLNG